MTTIKVNIGAQIEKGPQISIAKDIAVNTYDKIDEIIIAPGQERTVNVQPSSKDQISFLLITSSLYTDPNMPDHKISYGVDTPKIGLDQPHIYLGKGSVSVLGGDPKVLKFKNDYPAPAADDKNAPKNEAKIEILVGRDALQPPA